MESSKLNEIEKTFSELTKYSEVVTYTQYKANANDLIINNLMKTIPDINYEEMKGKYTTAELMVWINTSTSYLDRIIELYHAKLRSEILKIDVYRNKIQKTKKLDMEKVAGLPMELIETIYSYLPYETKYDILKEKYKNIGENLMKMTVNKLKIVFNKVIYKPFIDTNINNNGVPIKEYYFNKSCLPKNYYLKTTFSNKHDIVERIITVMDNYRNIDPKTKQVCNYFYKNTLKMMRNIVYLTRSIREKEIEKNKKKRQKKSKPVIE